MIESSSFLCPMDGIFLGIENLPDPTFAEGLLGPGFAINPFHGEVIAPFDGTIIQIHPSHHALTLQHKNGLEFLLHLGIDTVKLKGAGFSLHCQEKQVVKKGDRLITWDLDYCGLHAKSLLSAFIFLKNSSLVEIDKELKFQIVRRGQTLGQMTSEGKILGHTLSPNHGSASNERGIPLTSGLRSQEFTFDLPQGMHARPAAKILQFAKNLNGEYYLAKGDLQAPLTSVTLLLSLNIQASDKVSIWSPQKNSSEFERVFHFLKNLREDNLPLERQKEPAAEKISETAKNVLTALSASSGMARGLLANLKHVRYDIPEHKESAELELNHWTSCLVSARKELNHLVQISEPKSSEIFSAHLALLDDSHLLQQVKLQIQNGNSAARAWKNVFESSAQELSISKNHFLAERAADLRDLGDRLLRLLLKLESHPELQLSGKILYSEEITPSQVILFSQSQVAGLISSKGGTSGHAAILARSLQIPFLVNLHLDETLLAQANTEVLLNAYEGSLTIQPNAKQILSFEEFKSQKEKQQQSYRASKELPAVTRDGQRIEIAANLGSIQDSLRLKDSGADGIGLLRTEFIFLEQESPPSVEIQKNIFQNLADSLPNKNFVVRTLDIGGDKSLPYLNLAREENPFLGIRGIRLSLKFPELFENQLRALARTKHSGKLSIMFPMVTELSEFLTAKDKALEIFRAEGNQQDVDFGIMIEVPSSALLAESFAPHVDFFSIGTNDLSQYTLAMDRGHHELASTLDSAHPSVLKLIAMTAVAGQKYKKWVGVCGNFASDPLAIPLLLGLGVDELSVSLSSVAEVKALIRNVHLSDCQKLSQLCLAQSNAREVRALMQNFQIQNQPPKENSL